MSHLFCHCDEGSPPPPPPPFPLTDGLGLGWGGSMSNTSTDALWSAVALRVPQQTCQDV